MNSSGLVSFDDATVAFASKTDKELKDMYFLFSLMNQEHLTKIGTKIIKTALKMHFPIQGWIKRTIFKQFCGGESIEECQPAIDALYKSNIHTILDYSFEGENKEENYEKTVSILDKIIQMDAASDAISFSVLKMSSIASPILLEKVQKGIPLSPTEGEVYERVKWRLDEICRKANENKVKLMIDAEESWIQGTIDVLVFNMMNKYNKEEAIIFNTYQMYRKDMLENLQSAVRIAKIGRFHLGVKLVRGAYLDKESERAKVLGIPSIIHESKQDTDNDFNLALKFCIDNINTVELCCGSHNEDSNRFLTQLMEIKGLDKSDKKITFSQLYGMGDHISFNLAKEGFNVTKYLPFGKVEEVIPYLIRRAEENKSMAGQTSRELALIKKEIQRRKTLNSKAV